MPSENLYGLSYAHLIHSDGYETRGRIYGWHGSGAIGMIGLWRAGRPVFPIVATVVSIVLVVAIVYGNTRFRLPAELALMFPAAVTVDAGLAGAGRRWAAWKQRREAAPPPEPAGPAVVAADVSDANGGEHIRLAARGWAIAAPAGSTS